ncbi:hypothetical protein BCR42DRAFT_143771 [Absidia repens]|uniref:Zn(2)-C6 fungal-type domain-containing protein n=1 Tax=Absidia repens TaxID=90262 RepID=A0A1X2I336_9FUNG|nr:hypothetical protein BCR42DRAFT_143771 [Absidia repens]
MMDHSTNMMTQQQQQQPQGQSPVQHVQVSATDQTSLGQESHGANKRKQVKNACSEYNYETMIMEAVIKEKTIQMTIPDLYLLLFAIANCQKACKKCDDDRPCARCIKFGLTETCVSSIRKERKKGMKRGPYKRKGKQDDEQRGRKAMKSSDSDSGSHNGEQQLHVGAPAYAQANPAAAQQGPISYPYGYPPNLNQYHFLPYQYPYYGGDNKAPQTGPYAMNYPPVYHYPMAMPGAQHLPPPTAHQQSQHQHQTTPSTNEPSHPDNNNKKQQRQQGSSDFEPKKDKQEVEDKSNYIRNEMKPQPMTPVPSSSSSPSSITMSSPRSNQDDESVKCARLTQLCSAALNQEESTTTATTTN